MPRDCSNKRRPRVGRASLFQKVRGCAKAGTTGVVGSTPGLLVAVLVGCLITLYGRNCGGCLLDRGLESWPEEAMQARGYDVAVTCIPLTLLRLHAYA